MRSSKQPVELLAPAGSEESLHAAVSAGADAVYLGWTRFGARSSAANFDDEGLSRAIEFCHLCGVKVYVTVNTLLHDRELSEASHLLIRLYSLGVDAVLVQDAGLADIASEYLPELSLHASTQMTVNSGEGVCRAAEEGFERVVLARELTPQEISSIPTLPCAAKPGLEIFIHGALCYCYSGQCLLSSFIGGRSGNRGACAQPCRKQYTPVTAATDEMGRPVSFEEFSSKSGYLLSPGDLCTYPCLPEILLLPVESLKIEGRMRSAEYVATVVSVYRKALDEIDAGKDWHPDRQDMKDLRLAFNREFTGGPLCDAFGPDIMSHDRPGDRGVPIGRVKAFDVKRMEAVIVTDPGVETEPGDGIFFLTGDGTGDDTGVGAFVRKTSFKRDGLLHVRTAKQVPVGSHVSQTGSARNRARAQRLSEEKGPHKDHAVTVDLRFSVEGATPRLDGKVHGVHGEVDADMTADFVLAPSKTQPLTKDRIASLLKRSGDSLFEVGDVSVKCPDGFFAPLSLINGFRRSFLSHAETRYIASLQPSLTAVTSAEEKISSLSRGWKEGRGQMIPPAPPSIAVYADSPEVVCASIEAGCRRIYYEPDILQMSSFEDKGDRAATFSRHIAECASDSQEDAVLIWKWPRITRREDIDTLLPLLSHGLFEGVEGIMVEGGGAAYALHSAYPAIPLHGSFGLNIFNHRSVHAWEWIFTSLALSQEMSFRDLNECIRLVHQTLPSPPVLEYMVQGTAEIMVSEHPVHSPRKDKNNVKKSSWTGIKDQKGHVFPCRTDGSGRMHLYNSRDTCLVDHLPALFETGVDILSIDCRRRTPSYAGAAVREYLQGCEAVISEDPSLQSILTGCRNRLLKISEGGITMGHFLGKRE